MISNPYVLVVSTIADAATDDVVRRLASRSVEFRRINTEAFPFTKRITSRFGAEPGSPWLEIDGEVLATPAAIWYRRYRAPMLAEGMEPGVYDFCLREARAGLVGSLLATNCRWMSHPTHIWQAEYKPFQLAMAEKVGLWTPRTVITNDPAAVREAFHEFGGMIVKPLWSGYVAQGGEEHAIYTSRVTEADLEHVARAQLSPAIYQELIPKRFDIRVTIVGKQLFVAAIDSQSDPDAAIDWRHTSDPELPHHRHELPTGVADQLLALMILLNLNFAAIDLVLTPDGKYVFLEVNPNGQWLWIDDKLELGISQAVANWLAGDET